MSITLDAILLNLMVARRMTLWDDTRRALPQRVQPPVWPLAALAEQSLQPFSAVENSVGLRKGC